MSNEKRVELLKIVSDIENEAACAQRDIEYFEWAEAYGDALSHVARAMHFIDEARKELSEARRQGWERRC